MWQCAIQRPGLLTSKRMSTLSPVRTSTVSFHYAAGRATFAEAGSRWGCGQVRKLDARVDLPPRFCTVGDQFEDARAERVGARNHDKEVPGRGFCTDGRDAVEGWSEPLGDHVEAVTEEGYAAGTFVEAHRSRA